MRVSSLAAVAAVGLMALLVVPPPATADWVCGASSYAPNPAREFVRNGGFEGGLASWYTVAGASPPTISTTISHSGTRSPRFVSPDGSPVHTEQNLAGVPPVFAFTFWFYVDEWGSGGHFSAQLMRNWNPTLGIAEFVTRVWWLPAGTMEWNAWMPSSGGGVTQRFTHALTQDAWHSIETVVDERLGLQCLFVDGVLVGSASVSPASSFGPPAVVLVGDVSTSGDAGTAHYDDVSIQATSHGAPEYATTLAAIGVGIAGVFAALLLVLALRRTAPTPGAVAPAPASEPAVSTAPGGFCPLCGTRVGAEDRFCHECGKTLPDLAVPGGGGG